MKSSGKTAGKTAFRALTAAAPVLLLLASLLMITGCGQQAGTGTSTTPTTDTGGRMQIAETYYDFGRVPVNTKVEHDFEIKNTGTGPLFLQQPSVKLLQGC